jgi:GDP-mannose 4,6 dehydratase
LHASACPASPVHYQHDPVQTTKTSVHGAINMLGLAKQMINGFGKEIERVGREHFEVIRHDVTFPLYLEVDEIYNLARVLVTGGAGFLGSHLSEKLLSDGAVVVCVDNFFTGARRNIEHLLDHKHIAVPLKKENLIDFASELVKTGRVGQPDGIN